MINEEVRRMIAVIHRRVSESAVMPDIFTRFVEVIDLVRYSIAVDWPKRQIAVDDQFSAFYRETAIWFQNSRNAVTGLKPWEDSPFRPKDFEKRSRNLYGAWLRLNATVKQEDVEKEGAQKVDHAESVGDSL
jgi:hypothetical protein